VKQVRGQSMAQAASAKRASSVPGADEASQGITAITVQGYKSIDDEVTVSIAPLTILAGANSSGKSSLMQPLLLMKQTLEAPYDPGALMLNGPNLKFTSAEQLFTLRSSPKSVKHFNVGVEIQKKQKLKFTFEKYPEKLIDLALMSYQDSKHKFSFSQEMDHESLLQSFPNDLRNVYESYLKIEKSQEEIKRINSTINSRINKLIGVELEEVKNDLEYFANKAKDSMSLSISRNRCFFDIYLH
jgi:predicted ATPase